MSQQQKSAYFQALKMAGVTFDKHYRDYTEEELASAYSKLIENEPDRAVAAGLINAPPDEAPKGQPDGLVTEHPQIDVTGDDLPPSDFFGFGDTTPATASGEGPQRGIPRRGPDPNEMAGARQNTQDEDEPIREDEFGRLWFQEEVRKPAYPKPRGRRVLQYTETGVKQQQIPTQDGSGHQYLETFEVAGDEVSRVSEVKITLPSYQVGCYLDPRFPFKVHVYNDKEGFDLFGVQEYYGGPERVPAGVKRVYVENVLCYDIRTTVRAIEDEYRRLQLAGKA